MSFPIRLDCIFFGALFTFPLLLTMLSTKVLFYTCEITKCSWRVMVDTSLLWTDVNFLLNNIFVGSLSKLPWKVVSSSMKLKVLISLEPFVAYFTDESVCCHECLRWESNDLGIWICIVKLISITNLKYMKKLQIENHRKIYIFLCIRISNEFSKIKSWWHCDFVKHVLGSSTVIVPCGTVQRGEDPCQIKEKIK